jgi:hypothetical protein
MIHRVTPSQLNDFSMPACWGWFDVLNPGPNSITKNDRIGTLNIVYCELVS